MHLGRVGHRSAIPSFCHDSGLQKPFVGLVPGSDSITQLVAMPTGQQSVLTGCARGMSPGAATQRKSLNGAVSPVFSPQQHLRPA